MADDRDRRDRLWVSLLVIELKADSAWGTYRAQVEGTEWLKSHIP